MRCLASLFLLSSFLTCGTISAYTPRSSPSSLKTTTTEQQQHATTTSRRGLFRNLWQTASVGALVATTTGISNPQVATAAAEDTVAAAASAADHQAVYFGVGCFWHIQHEFIEAEREILGRNNHQLTSAAGYAGGKAVGESGQVCYHNFKSIADYGRLGHGEVVGMNLPVDKIADFATVYFSLFNPRTKDRVDPQDRGAEYRSLIGFPGGTSHPSYPAIQEAAAKAGFTLQAGKGNDPDTLGKGLVYVMDSNKFPFYQAEVYHQYHNDFQSPPYGKEYNKLADLALEEGRIQTVLCPDRV